MLFTEPGFCFLLLPLLGLVYFALPLRAKNLALLVSSIFFYWWGEKLFTLILISVAANWAFGLVVDKDRFPRASRFWVWAAVAANLGLLGVYKYGNFGLEIVSDLLVLGGGEALRGPYDKPIHLPIGISFYTFQGLSYVLDVHWGLSKRQRNPLDVGLYIALFPQLIAGPIVRYREIARQLTERSHRLADVSAGFQRFVVGLGKKMLLANPLGRTVDLVFATPAEQLGPDAALLGLVCFAFQIYFDFSGYSDMAIGLGRMFGFRFPENFRYPYISRSVTEMWQRWHITLGNWLRDYLFFPLAGKRPSPGRIRRSLFTVFLLCGLWHGAAWTYVLWGAWNGLFLTLERTSVGRRIEAWPAWLQWAYTMGTWLFGLALFRATSLEHAGAYLLALIGIRLENAPLIHASAFLDRDTLPLLLVAAACSAPLLPGLEARLPPLGQMVRALVLYLVFLASLLLVASQTFNPFLYFQF